MWNSSRCNWKQTNAHGTSPPTLKNKWKFTCWSNDVLLRGRSRLFLLTAGNSSVFFSWCNKTCVVRVYKRHASCKSLLKETAHPKFRKIPRTWSDFYPSRLFWRDCWQLKKRAILFFFAFFFILMELNGWFFTSFIFKIEQFIPK